MYYISHAMMTLDQIPKAGEVSVGLFHNLEEAQALLLNLPDYSPHKSTP